MPVMPVDASVERNAAGVAVAAVRAEVATVAVPEAANAAKVSSTINRWVDIVFPVNSGKLLTVLPPPKRVSTGVACVATEANTVLVAFGGNVEATVLGVAVLTFPVKQVDT